MDAEAILRLADQAARSVRKRYECTWSREDFEDARQEAAAGIIRALRDGPAGAGVGYYVRAGQQGATRAAFRHRNPFTDRLTCPDGSEREDVQIIEPTSRRWSRPLSDEDLPLLRAVLSRVPRKVGARGGPKTRDQLAVARDLIMLQALSEGCSRSAIAERLSISRDDVCGYMYQLRRRLAMIAEFRQEIVDREAQIMRLEAGTDSTL